MKAISLWQPFASAIPHGLKRIETRHWSTNYRGDLAIHAAKKSNSALRADARNGGLNFDDLPLGCVVAVVTLTDVLPTELLRGLVMPSEIHFGDYSSNRFGWILQNIRAIKPFPYKGGQGFFNIPEELFL